jgi:glycosyltransferase involved in cell wall biosynthesis
MKSPGLFYNADIRNNGTARRVSEAFFREGYVETGMKRYSRPFHKDVDYGAHDFWLFVDDGRDDIPMELPKGNAPKCCYLIDTHLGYDKRLEWAKLFDYVFIAQRSDIERFKADGVNNVHWLPLACTPSVDLTRQELKSHVDQLENWKKEDLDPKFDVAFVGFLNRGHVVDGLQEGKDRVDYLHKIFSFFPNSWLAFNCFMVEAAVRYARSRVGFNVSIKNDLNMRFFEALSYGTCLVTNTDVDGIKETGLKDGIDFLGYTTPEEAVNKIQWALANPQEREKIAKSGHSKVRDLHTYNHRIKNIKEVIYG